MFYEKFKENRIKHGYSEEDIAKKLEVSIETVKRWETGISMPDLENVVKLSYLFDVAIDYLLKDRKSTSDFSYYTVVKDEKRVWTHNKIISLAFVMLSVMGIMTLLVIAFVEPIIFTDPVSGLSYQGLQAYLRSYLEVKLTFWLSAITLFISALYLFIPEKIILRIFAKKN